MVKILLQAGAKVNQADSKGRTTLIYATHDVKLLEDPFCFDQTNKVQGLKICPIPSMKRCDTACILALLEAGASIMYEIFDVWESVLQGSERETWHLSPGRLLKTVALLPAVHARCVTCTKLLAQPGAYRNSKPQEQAMMLGPHPNLDMWQILRNSYETPIHGDMLKHIVREESVCLF